MRLKFGKYMIPIFVAGSFFLNSCGKEEKPIVTEDVFAYEMEVMTHHEDKVSGKGLSFTVKQKYPGTDVYKSIDEVVDYNVKNNPSERVRTTIGRDIMRINNGRFEVEPDGIRGDIIYARENYQFPEAKYPVLELTKKEFENQLEQRLEQATGIPAERITSYRVVRKPTAPVYTRPVEQ